MTNPLLRKLSNFVACRKIQQQALGTLTSRPKSYAASLTSSVEGDPTSGVYLILDGVGISATRSETMVGGRSCPTSSPVTICDQRIFVLNRLDHNIGTFGTRRALPKSRKEAIIDLTG